MNYNILFALFVSNVVFAQESAYYGSAYNKSDESLKYELNQIIKNHTEFTYTASSTDVWDILKDTDKDTANSNNVILLYSQRSVNAAQEYNGGLGWSREHVWASSRGEFGTRKGAGTDVHHLRPCDIGVNSTRNNRNFDACITCVDVIDDGFITGSKYDANLWTFEPPDAVKGDVARMLFYMAVRYEGEGSEPDLELTNTLLTKNDKSSLQANLNTLLHWNRSDSVSNWERNRNNIIDSLYQHNRNPFIDYPELAEFLWGDSIGSTWMPTAADTIISASIAKHPTLEFKIYPNPTTSKIRIESTTKIIREKITIHTSAGVEVLSDVIEGADTEITLEALPDGIYFIGIGNEIKQHFRLLKTAK